MDEDLEEIVTELAERLFYPYPLRKHDYTVFVDLPNGKRGSITIILTEHNHSVQGNLHKIIPTETVVTKEELQDVITRINRWHYGDNKKE